MDESLNTLSGAVIGAAIEVHRVLVPGLLINFNVPVLIKGIRRRILSPQKSPL